MTDKQQFKALADSLGLTGEEIAEGIGLTIASYNKMMQAKMPVPKWVKIVLLFKSKENESTKEIHGKQQTVPSHCQCPFRASSCPSN